MVSVWGIMWVGKRTWLWIGREAIDGLGKNVCPPNPMLSKSITTIDIPTPCALKSTNDLLSSSPHDSTNRFSIRVHCILPTNDYVCSHTLNPKFFIKESHNFCSCCLCSNILCRKENLCTTIWSYKWRIVISLDLFGVHNVSHAVPTKTKMALILLACQLRFFTTSMRKSNQYIRCGNVYLNTFSHGFVVFTCNVFVNHIIYLHPTV